MQTTTFPPPGRTSPRLWLHNAAIAMTLILGISACGGSSSPGQPGAASNALVVWTQSDGVSDSIWYNRYQ